MGNALRPAEGEENDDCPPAIDDITHDVNCNRKNRRKRRCLDAKDENETSSKVVKLDTPRYVHQKLFIEGCDSDVIIHALGRSWHLHRVYLEQCDYFRALFCGKWHDSYQNAYTLEILDSNITYTGLNNVLASLYNNEIEIDKNHIAGVIGAAAMLNLNIVMKKCEDILLTYMSQDKILLCLELSDTYGLSEVLNRALDFLKLSFWRYALSTSFLRKLKYDWFARILLSDFVCVKENEMDLYTAIKMWIYMRNFPDECACTSSVTPSSTPSTNNASDVSFERCEHLSDERMREFFHSDAYDWRRYIRVLRHLRVSQLTQSTGMLKVLKRDGMIPKELVDNVMCNQWKTLLIDEESYSPLDESMDDDYFYRHCFRLGRHGNFGSNKTTWRWLGYFYGMDLIVNYSNGVLRFTRNCKMITNQQRTSVKICETVGIHYRVIVCNEDDGTGIFDSKRRYALLNADETIKVALFKIPRSNFSVHLFYLASATGPSSTFYWDNLMHARSPQKN